MIASRPRPWKLLLTSALSLSLLITPFSIASAKPKDTGETAYQQVQYLSENIGPRVAGTVAEKNASQYLATQLQVLGLHPTIQNFSYTRKEVTYQSQNVIATKKGKSNKVLIIGAHYDSVSTGKGADDNGSSIGVVLETLKALSKKKTPYTVKVIFFGAEEAGLQGSKYYVSKMTDEEKKNTVGMINLDSLIAGDNMYVYGDQGSQGKLRDFALKIAKKHKIPMSTNPGLNPEYPAGTTGDWSDHSPFKAAGIPYAYFEATNWEIGDLDGYTQTVKHGAIWHTAKDNLTFLEQEFPGRVQTHLKSFTTVLTELVAKADKELQ
ncbi:M20/M25/M40 family metallo-hydrolase [Shimazuella kribbensis]|uniref:M20/M25/M40 family metallo-hydrolase n=1 Tax=Shimazuella kribbensis TaxID=139808 RepID=UPI0004164AE9|nr:M20/M25/M40 family metallo-hydrolase [Shimazuella kribbensis]